MITKNPFHLAELLNITVKEARKKLREEPEYVPGFGRPHMHPYIVSRMRLNGMTRWPQEDYPRLHEHRKLHDEGKVTMCQGRDGDWIIQYAIPNHPPVKREPYFFAGDYH